MPVADLLTRRQTRFTLWLPERTSPPPALVIGTFQQGTPPTVTNLRTFPLREDAAARPGLWEIEASRCELQDGQVYHYWFEVSDAAPWHRDVRVRRTDPLATTTDWRVLSPAAPGASDGAPQPAAVIRFRDGRLWTCDPGGVELAFEEEAPDALGLPANGGLVIYELPPRWSQTDGSRLTGVGTFRDVRALVDAGATSPNFGGLPLLDAGRQYLVDLGVNALELLPIADSPEDREWGYPTANAGAPDFDLGFPRTFSWPTTSADLAALVQACHGHRIRFFLDVVLGYGKNDPCVSVADSWFHVPAAPRGTRFDDADPEQRTSRTGELRQDWGGRLWRYIQARPGVYDPITGRKADVVPARALLRVAVERWLRDFHVDGLRLDSVETIANWDFVQQYRDHARTVFAERCREPAGAEGRFHVIGEELTVPLDLLKQDRVDALWNERFKQRLRHAALGQNAPGDHSFEETVRRLVDCREAGFPSATSAINYFTSHDVEGFQNERLHDFLANNLVVRKEERVKLAFTCLLTAAGIPMILAGEEFADQSDLRLAYPQKQFDAVNFERLQYALDQDAGRIPVDGDHPDERWRARVHAHVRRLIALRTSHPALAGDRTSFVHVDFEEGKRVLVWRRGDVDPVLVVANFSEWGTAPSPTAEYRIPGWPAAPAGKTWFEVTTQQAVPAEWAGRWALYPWSATVWRLQSTA